MVFCAIVLPLIIVVIVEPEYVKKRSVAAKFRVHSATNNIHSLKLVFVFIKYILSIWFAFGCMHLNKWLNEHDPAFGIYIFQSLYSFNGCSAQMPFYVESRIDCKRNS